MARSYNVEIAADNTAAAKTLLLLENASDMVLRIDAARITNSDTDANEQLFAALLRVTTKGSPAGTSVTPEKRDQGDPASSVTVLAELSAEPTAYAPVAHTRQGFSNLSGFLFEPQLGAELYVPPSGLIGLKLLENPAASVDLNAEIAFTELG